MNLRTQAIFDSIPVKDAKKEVKKWRKSLKKIKHIDEVEIYPQLLVKKENGYGFI